MSRLLSKHKGFRTAAAGACSLVLIFGMALLCMGQTLPFPSGDANESLTLLFVHVHLLPGMEPPLKRDRLGRLQLIDQDEDAGTDMDDVTLELLEPPVVSRPRVS